jgi:hypothetical protein
MANMKKQRSLTKKKAPVRTTKKTPTKRAGKRKISKPVPRVPGAY